jgi:FkbM family methyltransferase
VRVSVLLTAFLTEFGIVALDEQLPTMLSRQLINDAAISLDISEKTQRSIYAAKIYESGLTHFVLAQLKQGDVFLDVGANVGYFSLLASGNVGKEGKVIAFEPEKQNYNLLLQNILLNNYKNIEAIRQAIGDHSGISTLHINPLNRGGNSLLPFTEYHTAGHFYSKKSIEEKYAHNLEQEVPLQTLDSFLAERGLPHIAMLKIDVEGFEASVVEGMQETLSKKLIKYILIETGVESRDYILKNLHGHGYYPHRITAKGDVVDVTSSYPRDILFLA